MNRVERILGIFAIMFIVVINNQGEKTHSFSCGMAAR
jgi:hypothetical protein